MAENGKESAARYRLPFALCKEFGIQLPEGATPRDAWEALDGYGINPENEYAQLSGGSRKQKAKEAERREKIRQAKDPEHSPDYNYKPKPGYIAGVKKGKPMTFEEANRGRCNPYYKQSKEFGGKYYGYATNCQTCVVAFEARMRGYDVRALPNNRNPYIKDLSHQTNLAFRDLHGNSPSYISMGKGKSEFSFVQDTVGEGRYTLQFIEKWCGEQDGHIISAFRVKGQLMLYDPQNGRRISGEKQIKRYLRGKTELKMMRVDNMSFNEDYSNYILKGVNK